VSPRKLSEAGRTIRDRGSPGTDSLEAGDFFILSGQMVYVASVGEPFKAPNGGTNARLRAIYANGIESNLLLWSLQRALYKDENGRRHTSTFFRKIVTWAAVTPPDGCWCRICALST
jgi:hypothetical protein